MHAGKAFGPALMDGFAGAQLAFTLMVQFSIRG
jgi:hypothetical protein